SKSSKLNVQSRVLKVLIFGLTHSTLALFDQLFILHVCVTNFAIIQRSEKTNDNCVKIEIGQLMLCRYYLLTSSALCAIKKSCVRPRIRQLLLGLMIMVTPLSLMS